MTWKTMLQKLMLKNEKYKALGKIGEKYLDENGDVKLVELPDSPNDKAIPAAVRVVGEVMKNEETRFNNLNTRAMAILTASSLILTLAGFFAKDLISDSTADDALARFCAFLGVFGTLIGLVLVAAVVVFGVLSPGRRPLFGKNEIIDEPVKLLSSLEVDVETYKEYRAIFVLLVIRNSYKAFWLTLSYLFFFLTLLWMSGFAFVALIGFAL